MPGEIPEVRIEFFGTARLHAGVSEITLPVGPLRELLRELQLRFPRLKLLTAEETLSPHYLVSVNGVSFIENLDTVIQVEDSVLVLGGDAGG
jgi:molybdopterin converting factor small subunit